MGARGALGEAAGRGLGALRLPLACASLLVGGAAGAQVVLDGSLGPAGPAPFDGTTWHVTDDLGTQSGGNLFHSLSALDVPEGLSASFHQLDPASPMPPIVIVRVPVGPSTVDGTIASAYSNTFILNPNGFSFGPKSAVQAQGSFYLSTADVLRFGNDVPLDARSSTTPVALSADEPSAFGFLSDAPAPIVFDLDSQDTGFDSLPVPRGATFALVGGDVRIDGWSASPGSVPTIRIEGGSVEIAAVGAAGVDVPVDVASFDARAQAPGTLGEVVLGRNALVDVGSPLGAPVGSGRVVIRSGRFVVDDARIDVVAGSALAGDAVAIDLEASEEVEIRAGARLTVASATAPAGDLRISAPSVEVTGAGTRLTATASGNGKAPDVLLEADELHLGDESLVFLRTTQPAGNTGGRFAATAETVLVDGEALVLSRTQGGATGGAIELDVGELRVESLGQIVSENTSSGAGGAIDVEARREVAVTSRGSIRSQATGAASSAGGDVSVDAGVRILVVGEDSAEADVSQISALTSSSTPGGNGGNLRVSAPTIELRDAGQLRTTTSGAGQGGALDVVDTDLLLVVGNAMVDGRVAAAGLFARADPADGFVGQPGDGGDITIGVRVVQVADGGEISTRTLGGGDAGNLVISRAELIEVRGGPRGFSTLSTRGAIGNGGDIEIIDSGGLVIASGAEISASTVGTGDAGRVVVSADRIAISGAASGLFSKTNSAASDAGDGGNIEIEFSDRLEVRDQGTISVESEGGGGAGDIAISGGPVGSVILLGGSVVAESARSARAGNIAIETGGDFIAGSGASVRTNAEGNASGGRVAIGAGGIFYATDSLLNTQVSSGLAGGSGDGGDVDVPGALRAPPSMAILNRSAIVAKTGDGKGGNIRVAARDLLASQGVVIDATSERGVAGEVQITSPDATLAGQITPLPSNFFDASKLMSTACDARRARSGSFVVQTRDATEPLPDAPLAPSDLGAGRAEGRDELDCPG